MLNFITNQTTQYEAYTDRYLKFKIEFRELVPYKKKNISISVKQKAKSFLKSINDIVVLINGNIIILKEHQEFLAKVRLILAKEDWIKYAININQITPFYYYQFIDDLLKGIDVPRALNNLTKSVDSNTEQK